jgi:hypothetical protein
MIRGPKRLTSQFLFKKFQQWAQKNKIQSRLKMDPACKNEKKAAEIWNVCFHWLILKNLSFQDGASDQQFDSAKLRVHPSNACIFCLTHEGNAASASNTVCKAGCNESPNSRFLSTR